MVIRMGYGYNSAFDQSYSYEISHEEIMADALVICSYIDRLFHNWNFCQNKIRKISYMKILKTEY